MSFAVNKVKKTMVLLLCSILFIYPRNVLADCCSTVTITNFPTLVNLYKAMEAALWQTSIIPTLANNFITEQLRKILLLPGVLNDVSAEKVFEQVQTSYLQESYRLVNELNSKMSQGYRPWYCHFVFFLDRCKDQGGNIENVVLPVFEWEDWESGKAGDNVVKYAYSFLGDMNYVYSAWEDVKELPIPDVEKKRLALDIGNLEMAKKNIAQQAIQNAAFLKSLSDMRKQIMEMDARISKATDYTSDQAMKDMLKIQILQGMLISEMLRLNADNELRLLAVENARLADERKNVMSQMNVYVSSLKKAEKQ